MSPTRQYCTFFVAGMHLGLEVLEVQEVLRIQPMTRVPLAPSVVRGLINLRGQIVTALDLRTRLGLPPRAGGKPPMNVVARASDGAVSLLVDEIGDVLEVSADSFERPPPTLQGEARRLIRGVHKLEGGLLLLLDIDRALSVEAMATRRAEGEEVRA